jgi:hypothetical protein
MGSLCPCVFSCFAACCSRASNRGAAASSAALLTETKAYKVARASTRHTQDILRQAMILFIPPSALPLSAPLLVVSSCLGSAPVAHAEARRVLSKRRARPAVKFTYLEKYHATALALNPFCPLYSLVSAWGPCGSKTSAFKAARTSSSQLHISREIPWRSPLPLFVHCTVASRLGAHAEPRQRL